jgi:hypothetical protein
VSFIVFIFTLIDVSSYRIGGEDDRSVDVDDAGMDDVGMDSIGMDGVGMDGVGMDGIGMDGIGMDSIGMDGVGMDGVGMDGVGMDGVGMDSVGMGNDMDVDVDDHLDGRDSRGECGAVPVLELVKRGVGRPKGKRTKRWYNFPNENKRYRR